MKKKKDPQIITKIKPIVYKYTWEGINYPSEKDDWKKFEKNNATIALSVFFVCYKIKNVFCLCFET